jgi:hypothetical protein
MNTILVLASLAASLASATAAETKPLRALLVTGGCCHDYGNQKAVIANGIGARANVEWTVVQEGGNGTRHVPFEESIYHNPEWHKGYDIVVHNECFSDDTDLEYVGKFLKPHHEGLPAVVIHCTMHTFWNLPDDRFREFLGVMSKRHGPQHPLDVKTVNDSSPVMKGFPKDFKTGNEELYEIRKVFPSATVLATAADKKKVNGEWAPTEREHAVIWLNQYGKGRVFGTTLAHNTKTMEDPAYLDLLARGLLWACDKLKDDGAPKEGYGPRTQPK